MKASKFTDAQEAFILKQGADGVPVSEICRKAGISQATYFNWKRKYDGSLPTEMRQRRQLEEGPHGTSTRDGGWPAITGYCSQSERKFARHKPVLPPWDERWAGECLKKL